MEKQLELRTLIRLPSPCWVRGDPTRVRQVLHNLLGNAVKFTARGQGELRVARGAGARVEFVVADTGPGIAPEDIERIFEPFWQAAPSERMAAGTGLGLNIALEMTRAMGGELRCTSELGQGTTFVLGLPLPEEERPRAANETNWGFDADMAPPLQRVLLAEDNEVNALVVRAMLDRAGCKVTVVDNGDDAVALATQADSRPDIVLMDCQMPVMDGLEASRRIRARERALALPHLPIVALTANTSLDDRAACRQAGMDLFLGKPFTERELLQAMAACREASTPS
jgi:CheY-like chemotaxis protein